MFERPRSGERAILVHVAFGTKLRDEYIQEFTELALSAGAGVLDHVRVTRAAPDPRFCIGSGKADDIARMVKDLDTELVIFDVALGPGQERNLEKLFSCRVLDRNGLIMDIFAQRARSFEGKLQVELAQLRHLSTRLVRGWTHLERQKGGIGLRGPGETQLETDRRLIGQRIKQLRRSLDRVDRQREQGRARRKRMETPTISLVGYTNAGKTTLFNALTGADAFSADQLFATLDPTLRKLELPGREPVVLADTVGFIRDLPHELVAAFRSTLKETRDADLLLHVVDASDEYRDERMVEVNLVLGEIAADAVPQIIVMNKIDRNHTPPRVDFAEDGLISRVWVSALDGLGLDIVRQAIAQYLAEKRVTGRLVLSFSEASLRSQLYELGAITDESLDEEAGWVLDIDLPERRLRQFVAANALDMARIQNCPCAVDDTFLQSPAGTVGASR